MRPRQSIGALAIVFALLAGCSSEPPDRLAQSNPPASQGQIAQHCVADGGISVWTSTELGSDEWHAELKKVKAACFDSVTAYGSMNGSTIERSERGLDEAKELGVGVEFSTKDILGTTDTDETNADHHTDVFGVGNDAQMDTLSKGLLRHSAVDPVLITDELPADPDDLEQWLPALKKRSAAVHKIGKQTSGVFYWNGSQSFYRAVKQHLDYVEVDYYPLPEDSEYGPVSAISEIGETLGRTAGPKGTFVLQAFGPDLVNHPELKKTGPAPTVSQMVDMARLAVVGRKGCGAMNLSFYIAGEPGSASLPTMGEAVHQIRQADWWINRREC
jgi:hypothetical protein